jgi:predicted DNA-binding ribbon-helix-helix protein
MAWSLEDSSVANGENVTLGNLMSEIYASGGKQTSAIQVYNVIIIVTDLHGARKSVYLNKR